MSNNKNKKKSFVCLKEGCWLSKHTKKEYDKLKNRFNNSIGQ